MIFYVVSLYVFFLSLFVFVSVFNFFIFLVSFMRSSLSKCLGRKFFFITFVGYLEEIFIFFFPFLSFCLFSFVPFLKTLASTCYFLCLVSQSFLFPSFLYFVEPLFPLYLFLSFYSSPVSLFFFRLSQPYL